MDIKKIQTLPFFFIIGRPRSGTTLLRTMLDAHPDVCIPQESPVILNLYKKYGNKKAWSSKDLEVFYNDLKSQHIFGVWNIDKEKLKNDLLTCEGDFTFQDLIKVLYLNFNSIYGKTESKIIGDKNPIYSVNFPEVFPIFRNAKFIHLTRDYRDQVVSMKKMDFEMSHPALAAYRWKLSIKELQYYKKKYPDQFFSVKYEDIVNTPESKLKEICNHLYIIFDPVMLEFFKKQAGPEFLPEAAMNKFHSSLFNPITTSKVNAWESKLSAKEVRIADMIVGKSAGLAGYSRKYEQFNIWLYISVLPWLFYGRIWNISRMIINVLPFRIKMAIIKIGQSLPGIYWKLKNHKKLESKKKVRKT